MIRIRKSRLTRFIAISALLFTGRLRSWAQVQEAGSSDEWWLHTSPAFDDQQHDQRCGWRGATVS